jgi:hypothetical protein
MTNASVVRPKLLSGSSNMSTPTDALNQTVAQKQHLDELFGELAARWKDETAVYSASWQIKAHPAYQQIVNLGEDAIPLLLGKLAQPCVQWMMALSAIAGEDPSPMVHAGNIVRMAEDWLAWGRHQGYLHGDAA